jgi:hypothetical protein
LDTTSLLAKQFIGSLSSAPTSAETSGDAPCPLALLIASAEALKAQTTKISLLAINSPFTPSAVITVLSALNESVLPCLVTAALLIDSERHTAAFHSETEVLVKTALRELDGLIGDIKAIALENGRNLNEELKDRVTTSAGRVWGVCDQLILLAKDGVVGFIIRKAKQYFELVKDGIQELREWDPAEERDWDGDSEAGSADEAADGAAGQGPGGPTDVDGDAGEDDNEAARLVALKDEKTRTLRVFATAHQIHRSIIPLRLERMGQLSPACAAPLDSLINCLHDIPDLVDEAVGSLYEGDIDTAAQHTRQVADRAKTAITIARDLPTIRDGKEEEGADNDKFEKWAAVWFKVVGEVNK